MKRVERLANRNARATEVGAVLRSLLPGAALAMLTFLLAVNVTAATAGAQRATRAPATPTAQAPQQQPGALAVPAASNTATAGTRSGSPAPAAAAARAPAPPPAPSPPPGIDAYFTPIREYGHTLSEDGKLLAYLRFEVSQYFIGVVDVDRRTVKYRIPIGTEVPTGLRWFGDRRLLFTTASGLMSINPDGTDLHPLLRIFEKSELPDYGGSVVLSARLWSVISTRLADPETVLVRGASVDGHESIYRLNVFTGEKTRMLDGQAHDINDWIVSPVGNAALAVRVTRELEFRHLRFDGTRFTAYRFGTHNLDYDGSSYLDKRAYIVNRTDNRDIVMLGENISGDRFRLVRHNLLDGTTQVLVEDPKYDVGTPTAPAEPIFDRGTGNLIGIRYQAQRERTVWFDAGMINLQGRIDTAYPDRTNRIEDASLDRSRLLVLSYSERVPGTRFIYESAADRFVRHSVLMPDLAEASLAPVQFVEYRTRDGQQIEAMLYEPRRDTSEHAGKPVPMIVLPHGGPFNRDGTSYDGTVQYFVAKGYAVLQPQFRGSVGYGRAHLLAGKASLSEVMIDDIADGARAMIERGIADRSRVFVLGYSYGGYAALESVLRYPELYVAAVSWGAPTDLDLLVTYYEKRKNAFGARFWTEMAMGGDRSRERRRALSPAENIAALQRPVLLIHGDADTTVPVEHAQLFETRAAGNPLVKVVVLKDEVHTPRLRSSSVYLAEKALAHFAGALTARDAAATPPAAALPAAVSSPAAAPAAASP